jgi:hypothetical protein
MYTSSADNIPQPPRIVKVEAGDKKNHMVNTIFLINN